MPKENPIINCHTHIFTKNYVPPFLAKTFVPWPFYYLLYTPLIIKLIRTYKRFKSTYFYNKGTWLYQIQKGFNQFRLFRRRNYFLSLLYILIVAFLVLNFVYHLNSLLLNPDRNHSGSLLHYVNLFVKTYCQPFIIIISSIGLKVAFLLFCLLFFKTIRNLFVFIIQKIKLFPGKNTLALFGRYLEIGEYAKYKEQNDIFKRSLEDQYPTGTRFVILPMDMEYMKAGSLQNIQMQMEELKEIKIKNPDTCLPFVFADPRRMTDKAYFDFYVEERKVVLKKGCLMQQYLEEYNFAGIKLYPALGYYPFDEILLPLYKYAVQNNIPIMTHCIKGIIFYRGKKKKEWDYHPIFKEGNDPLFLKEAKNINFCNNFTHPLNYLCLLDDSLLYEVIQKAPDNTRLELEKMFCCNHETKKVKQEFGLSNLKICLAHFGGEDQWNKFLEKDRYWVSNKLITNPGMGINFFMDSEGKYSQNKIAGLWKYADWYSIICSILLKYKNTYADISYILHDASIFPLLKWTISYPELGSRVLFGTDFYVVRNHHADKELLINLQAALSKEKFDRIARENPYRYLNLEEDNH